MPTPRRSECSDPSAFDFGLIGRAVPPAWLASISDAADPAVDHSASAPCVGVDLLETESLENFRLESSISAESSANHRTIYAVLFRPSSLTAGLVDLRFQEMHGIIEVEDPGASSLHGFLARGLRQSISASDHVGEIPGHTTSRLSPESDSSRPERSMHSFAHNAIWRRPA